MANSILIRSIQRNESILCETILRSLPDWFGIEEAIMQYRSDVEQMNTYVSIIARELSGFITLNHHNDSSAEIQVMALKKEFHGRGIGRAMLLFAEKELRKKSVQYLQVKTLGPSKPNWHYSKTRNFYFRQGFRPLEENRLWGKDHPCLIMVKKL